MKRNTPPPSSSPSAAHLTTETFQKHYGRGAGYPADPPHHSHPPPPPRHHPNYPPSHYGSGQHQHAPLPPLPPPGYRGGPPPGPPPPPHHGHGYSPHPSWHYPPRGPPHPEMPSPPSESRRIAPSSAAKKSSSAVPHPSLVTPKSHDSESLAPVAAADINKKAMSIGKKTAAAKSSNSKKLSKSKSVKKESSNKTSSSNNDDKEPEMEEEPKVEQMKQDFHFYAMDQYEDVKRTCQQQLANSETSIPDKSKELYLLTTLLNARLIQNWETAPTVTRAAYLKKEEGDRKRFMSEEEVASRHCATLTARRRSPKQAMVGGLVPAGSFGLSATVEVPSMSVEGPMKRPNTELGGDDDNTEGNAKRAKVMSI